MSTKTMANRPIAVIIAAMLAISIVFVSLDSNSNNISSNGSTAFAQPHFRFNPFREAGNYTFGAISSVQDDNNGKPAWILTGFWKTNLINHTSTITPTSNANGSRLQGGTADVFTASFRMVMTNGSAMHTHSITNFVLQNKSMPNKTVQVFNGTTTVSMKEGPVTNVPTSIKVMNNRVISIMLDQSKLKNHFGNTPIYGVVFEPRPGMHMGSNPG